MKTCYILVGAPGTGKSTWADTVDYDSLISSDQIITDIAHEYGLTYNEAFKNLIGFADQVFWNDITSAGIYGDTTIIVDRTHMTAKSRKRVIDILSQYAYNFVAVVFLPPEEAEWERRLANRPGKTIPDEIIQSMLRNYQEPTLDEGFSEIQFA